VKLEIRNESVNSSKTVNLELLHGVHPVKYDILNSNKINRLATNIFYRYGCRKVSIISRGTSVSISVAICVFCEAELKRRKNGRYREVEKIQNI